MFDIGIDKLVVVGVLVGLIVGPERLREWRRALPRQLGRLYALYQQGRSQVVSELDDLAPDWREYDPRQLHPRSVLRDLEETAKSAAIATSTTVATAASEVASEVKVETSPGEAAGQREGEVPPADPLSRGDENPDVPGRASVTDDDAPRASAEDAEA